MSPVKSLRNKDQAFAQFTGAFGVAVRYIRRPDKVVILKEVPIAVQTDHIGNAFKLGYAFHAVMVDQSRVIRIDIAQQVVDFLHKQRIFVAAPSW